MCDDVVNSTRRVKLFYGERTCGSKMGKVNNKGSVVSQRRRFLKASSGVGGKKGRGSSKVSLPPPPPSQSLVLDEDSGFGGDQSLDSESSLLSSPGSATLSTNSATSAAAATTSAAVAAAASAATLPSVLPSLTMVPQTVVESKVTVNGKRLHVDINGDEAQELPASKGTSSTPPIPPLISFRDVSLLSSIQAFQGNNTSTSLLCVDGTPQPCSRNTKVLRQTISQGNPPLTAQLSSLSSDGKVELSLVLQPEEQHRARYQTEGSRGAVKDRSGLGHPTVKLFGYNKATALQVFVGSDSGKTGPHMFYQVCRVSGKNSTPCKERRIDGTAIIEAQLEPENDMTMSCDCVGILKERNVDVEHRFKAVVSRGRKKSTKCRLVFRTCITLSNGAQETLQVVSQPIACTQPPGVPEISRKSLEKCPVTGGEEMFIFGKNFLKDTIVTFQQNGAKSQPIWEEKVSPDPETLQPIHLIVTVPKYYDQNITEEVTVQMLVSSGGKVSEPHSLTYYPLVTKKELPPPEPMEEKTLPKGVSPSALQLNLQYAETRSLPVLMPEAPGPAVVSQSSPIKISQASTSTVPGQAVMQQTMRVSRFPVNSAAGKKPITRPQRSSARIPKAKVSTGRTSMLGGGVSAQSESVLSSVPSAESNDLDVKEEETYIDENGSKMTLQKQSVQGTVSLESLVEMLKIALSLPSGSNLHNSVLQLVEELVKSMKENISSPGGAKTPEETGEKSSGVSATSQRISAALPVSATHCLSSLLTAKTQKSTGVSPIVPMVPKSTCAPTVMPPSTVMTSTVSPTVSLLPFTVLSSMPSLHTVSSGPRVARVAPITSMTPVASTTVVSSPGLARTVRVCVGETPISQEPPKKKMRDQILPMEYQYMQGAGINCGLPTTIVSQAAERADFASIVSAPQQKVVVSQCNPLVTPICTNTSGNTPDSNIGSSASQTIFNTSPVQNSSIINQVINVDQPMGNSTQQAVYQPINQGLMQTFNESANQHVNQPMAMDVTQTLMPTQTQACQPQTHHATQNVSQAEADTGSKIVAQHTNQQQPLNGSPAMPVVVSDPLLSQSTGLCQLMPTQVVVTATTTSHQAPMITTVPVASSALTRSDPLLSQSSPVAPMQLGTTTVPATSQSQQTDNRSQGEVLLNHNATTTQATMQSEVSSAINLSETELLNYFDPNCFDNV
ncbi:nuclear factor of activated T-cells 5-like isoform X3 [Penaeus chinensis]|uniref:nuclear factor of activated T-cells 5-like isoform X3 n=1 Tax=Penaeus chinensis TaxID=139456 RepID=UPI001FB58BA7|nr:nuclear factor of activated T-cells 5-like isoform X3 [Penaeus chinensis]